MTLGNDKHKMDPAGASAIMKLSNVSRSGALLMLILFISIERLFQDAILMVSLL